MTCFSIDAERKVTSVDQGRRAFFLRVASPPQHADRTLSQVLFNDDSTALIATIKGDRHPEDSSYPNNNGQIAVFPVSQDGVIASTAGVIQSNPEGAAFLSGATTIPGTNTLLVTDPSPSIGGAAIVSYDAATHKYSTVKAITIEGNKATSHAAFSASTGSVFVSDEQVSHLVEIDSKSGAILHDYRLGDEHKGFSDLQVAGGFVYALEPAEKASIAVVDVATGKEVQNFVAQGLGAHAQGLAVRT